MNEEQRAVLEAIGRLEQSRGGPIDEYTVARSAGILESDLSGQEYAQSAARERIRELFEELEESGMLRLERGGYWRPRTTLAGRRTLQGVPPIAAARARTFPEPQEDEVTVVAPTGALAGARPGGARRVWPAWWPLALRFGAGPLAPLLGLVGLLAALLLIVLIAARSASGPEAPTGTAVAVGTVTPPTPVTLPSVTPPPGVTPVGVTPTSPLDPTAVPLRRPTPTPTPRGPLLTIANTNNEGAFLYATPGGERRFAISEGSEVEDIGPDERDPQGRNWKHVRYGNFEGWILEQFTRPAEE